MYGFWLNCGRDYALVIQNLMENVCYNKAFKKSLNLKKKKGYKQFVNIMQSYSSALCLRVKLQYLHFLQPVNHSMNILTAFEYAFWFSNLKR